MSLAHSEISHSTNPSTESEISEEELADMVDREKFSTMIDQVGKMYQGWDRTQRQLGKVMLAQEGLERRQDRTDGRIAVIEQRTGIDSTFNSDPPEANFHGEKHEITERRTNMTIPIPRATDLLNKERELKQLQVEMLTRYAWWSKAARAAGVTIKQAWLSAFRHAVKIGTYAAVGWAAHWVWEHWLSQ